MNELYSCQWTTGGKTICYYAEGGNESDDLHLIDEHIEVVHHQSIEWDSADLPMDTICQHQSQHLKII